jgi:hypothetical protein
VATGEFSSTAFLRSICRVVKAWSMEIEEEGSKKRSSLLESLRFDTYFKE